MHACMHTCIMCAFLYTCVCVCAHKCAYMCSFLPEGCLAERFPLGSEFNWIVTQRGGAVSSGENTGFIIL